MESRDGVVGLGGHSKVGDKVGLHGRGQFWLEGWKIQLTAEQITKSIY